MIDRSSYEPLYRQIKKDIEAQILDGRIKIGDKLMSETEMLNHYKVGRVTIRNALAELVSTGCLRKEQGLGTFCAAMPRQGRRNIDVFLTTTDTYFTPYFLSGIGRELNKRESDLILHDTLDDMAVTARLLNETLDRGTDGIILQPYTGTEEPTEAYRQAVQRCQDQGVPLIVIDGTIQTIDTPYIVNNDERGGYLAAEHLIRLGHKRILGLFRDRYRDSGYRAAGYRAAMEKAGLRPILMDAGTTRPEEWVARIRAEGITGIVCYNDYLAAKCYRWFDKCGLRVGKDISVVGFDHTEISGTAIPRITTITHPKDKMGEQAAAFLLDWIEGKAQPPYHNIVLPELIQRESCCEYTDTP